MMIEKVSDECETCRKLQRNPEQLVVGFALGKVFNEAIERGVGGREIPGDDKLGHTLYIYIYIYIYIIMKE